MNKLYYGVALLLAGPLESIARPANAADSVGTPASRRHLITLHIPHQTQSFIPTLGYERQLRPQWSVYSSAGYDQHTLRYDYYRANTTGTLIFGSSEYRYSTTIVDVVLNRYLQARKPDLIGWFVGAGIAAGFNRTRIRDDYGSVFYRNYQSFQLRPVVRGGRHWALGSRWLLDTHATVAIGRYDYRLLTLQSSLCLGGGYRF